MLALPRPRRMSKETRRNLVAGLIFSSPFTLGFLAFTLYPMVASLVYSFQHYNGGGEQYGVQWRNYTYLFQSDDQFHQAVFNTLYMVVLGVPLTLVVGFLSAVLLNLPVKGQAIYRSAFVLPAFLPLVPVAMLWNWMFSAENGIVNYVLGFLHLPQPGWLIDPGWSKPSLILLNLWTVGTVTIIYLAALQDVPEALYEAAELDGAVQIFATAYVITLNTYNQNVVGQPQGSMMFYLIYLWQQAFTYARIGYASAMAWLLFVAIMIVTVALFIGSRRWVYYAGDAR
jgi:multiple sugar transport system permease protein